MNDTCYVCGICNRQIPFANRTIHELRCGSTLGLSVSAQNKQEPLTSVQESILPTEASESATISNHERVWGCIHCTFINLVPGTLCSMCGGAQEATNHNGSDSESDDDSNSTAASLNTELAERTASGSSCCDTWSCNSCTYANPRSTSQCIMCDTYRPPDQITRQRLIEPILETNSYNPISLPVGNTTRNGEPSSQSSDLAGSMLLGAGIGAGIAWLNDRSISQGAMTGAGAGALGNILLEAVVHAQQRESPMVLHSPSTFSADNIETSGPPAVAPDAEGPTVLQRQLQMMQLAQPSAISTLRGEMVAALMMDGRNGGRGGDILDGMSFEQMLERFQSPDRPVNQRILDQLPVRIYEEPTSTSEPLTSGLTSNSCSICLETYDPGDSIRTLPCLHQYHVECVDNWLKRNDTCPICKHSLSP
mmetsp:Transcript_11885/g.19857  ORF Transcript_11885/g.19857 Transcript_11885/m.19857 type:complete len:421 (-) Transcript_11885:1309-2571(-)